MKNKLFATAAIAALALTGCSDSTGSSDDPATDATGEATETTTDEATDADDDAGVSLHGTYNSVDELQSAAVDAGYACAAPEELGWNQVSCDGVDLLGVFANPGSASAYVHKAEASAEEPFTALVGDNWVIIGEEADLTELQAELDGEIQNFDAAPAEEDTEDAA